MLILMDQLDQSLQIQNHDLNVTIYLCILHGMSIAYILLYPILPSMPSYHKCNTNVWYCRTITLECS